MKMAKRLFGLVAAFAACMMLMAGVTLSAYADVAGNFISGGIRGTGVSSGGQTTGVGNYGNNASGGIIGKIDAREGGKVVALGGVSKNSSYGGYGETAPETVQGELIIAGRSRALYSNGSASDYQFTYADGHTATGYTDYAGTTGTAAIASGTTTNNLRTYKRIVVASGDQPSAYPLYIAGVQVTSDNAADLTSIPGVSVIGDGYAFYDAENNILNLKNAIIANPSEAADIVDPIVYQGENGFAISAEGMNMLIGADGSFSNDIEADATHGIACGDVDLAITLLNGATFQVLPGEQERGATCSGIACGSLTVEGKGELNVKIPNAKEPFDTEANYTFAFDLSGDLSLSGSVSLYGQPSALPTMASSTAGLVFRGSQATITLEDEASFKFMGCIAGAAVITDGADDAFELDIMADEAWSGTGSFVAFAPNASSGSALLGLDVDATAATITHTWETCDMRGLPSSSYSGYDNLRRPEYTFADLQNYNEIDLPTPEYATLCLGVTKGGTYTSPHYYDGKMDGPMVATVEYGKEITITAEPILGYRFAGWYEGITDSSSFVYDNTGELISSEASYTFTPRGVMKLQAVFESTEKWTRLAGDNRYQTMAQIAQELAKQGFPAGRSCAIVATGATFPDALSASSLAGFFDCPVILTNATSLSPEAKDELERLGVYKVFIMGGELAVSKQVETAIKNIKGRPLVERVAGGTRQETAVKTMERVKGYSDTVIIATGFNFADSLSIGPWSYKTMSPILLTNKNGTLDAATIKAIQDCNRTSSGAGKKYKYYVIVGGPLAVSSSVESKLEAIGLQPLIPSQPRVAGANRYETSKLVAEFSIGFGMSADYPAIATGRNFPDALVAAPMQGKLNSVLLLVNGQNSPGVKLVTSEYYKDHLEHGYVIGGPLAVPQSLMDYIAKATASALMGSSALTAGSW